jgi:acyl carrier protein
MDTDHPERGPMSADQLAADIAAWIAADLRDEGQPRPVTVDEDLLDGGALDSVRLLKLVAWLEETCAIIIGAAEMAPDSFANARAIAAMARRLHSS